MNIKGFCVVAVPSLGTAADLKVCKMFEEGLPSIRQQEPYCPMCILIYI